MRNRSLPELSAKDADYARSLVLHEDKSVIVFNKPAGLAVQGGGGVDRSLDDLLVAFAKSNGKKPRLVHRLDRGTSGVVIVGRTKPATAFLSEEFATRRASKTYLALVEGPLPQSDTGLMEQSLVRVEEGGRPRMIVASPGRKGAQSAVTYWRVLARTDTHALMELKPETGRMHQIRIHLSASGSPILGDHLYGRGTKSADRLMLHAAALEIGHPDGGRVTYGAEVPDDFRAKAEALGLHSGLK
tara:strand:+ start:4830 stop:5561 length:732 start_codon:yes stop_codon:yes gene_type:complete